MQVSREKPSDRDFQLLGVSRHATPGEMKKAYRQLVRRWHPDHFHQQSQQARRQAEDKLKEINGAYRRILQEWNENKTSASRPQSAKRPPTPDEPPKPENSRQDTDPARNQGPPRKTGPKARKQVFSPAIWKRARYGLPVLILLLTLLLINLMPSEPEPDLPPLPIENGMEMALPIPESPLPPPPVAPPSPESAAVHPPTDEPLPPRKAAPPPAPSPDSGYFGLGASEADVLRVQGPPHKSRGQTWIYGLSDVQFKDGKVVRYNNFDRSLKVRMRPSSTYGEIPPFFSLGSSQDDVLAVQGTPTRVMSQSWYYGFSEVRFGEGRVIGFDNFFGNLKIRMLPSFMDDIPPGKRFFSIGSSANEVLAIQGTPSSVQGNMWFYRFSNIMFRNGRVEYVFDSTGNLRYSPPES